MLGILFGTACLIGLFKVARMGRGYGWRHHGGGGCNSGGQGYGHGWGGHHHQGGGRGRWGGGGGFGVGRNMFLRGLFERLETTPGQEKVIAAALEDVWSTMRQARGEWVDTTELAVLLTGETFDATAAEGLSGKADASFAKVRVQVVESMRKIHEALDVRQRQILSDWLRARGAGGFSGGHRNSAWM